MQPTIFLILEIVGAIILLCIIGYLAWTSKKKKYKFEGIGTLTIAKKKKKKKKRINKHEERCREIFSKLFRTRFKSIRPPFLKNPVTGKNLELDGFAPDISTYLGKGVAFEYDGRQHSKFTPHFHRHGRKEFEYQMKKDDWKDLKCKQEGILLIRIPYFVIYDDLERYIRKECVRHKLI